MVYPTIDYVTAIHRTYGCKVTTIIAQDKMDKKKNPYQTIIVCLSMTPAVNNLIEDIEYQVKEKCIPYDNTGVKLYVPSQGSLVIKGIEEFA